MDIEWIRQKVAADDYEFSDHAEEERQVDRIPISEVEHALLGGCILENYPDDPRGPSCLVLGYARLGYPIHAVCGKTRGESLRLITLYLPTLPKWLDERTRARR